MERLSARQDCFVAQTCDVRIPLRYQQLLDFDNAPDAFARSISWQVLRTNNFRY
jgi:hypothetical protein